MHWLFLRGLGREKRHWHPFLELFQKRVPEDTIIAIDLPGTGEFSSIHSPKRIDEISEFIKNKIPSTDKINIVAISLGAMVAMDLSLKINSGLNGLFLINCSTRLNPFYERLQPSAIIYLLKAGILPSPNQREKTILDLVCNHHESRRDLLQHWIEIQDSAPVSLPDIVSQLIAAAKYKPEVKKLRELPGVSITSRKDRMVSFKCSVKLSAATGWPLRINESAGHDLPADDPEWLIEQLLLS